MSQPCVFFKHGISIKPEGRIRPCCAMRDYPKWYIDDGKFEQWWEDLHQRSQTGFIPFCKQCIKGEKEKGSSMRTDFNKKLAGEHYGRIYWDIKLHNTCNLMCRMCGPNSSSTWQKNVKQKNNLIWTDRQLEQAQQTYGWHKTGWFEEVKKEIVNAKYVKFTGGEPFLIPQVKQITKHLIESDVSENIELTFTTNATQPLTEEWHSIFSNFKNVKFNLSLDGYGDRYNYVRAGSDWSLVENNFEVGYSKYSCSVHTVKQALNVANIPLLEDWCKKSKININVSPEIFEPEYLSFASCNPVMSAYYGIKGRKPFDPAMFALLVEQMHNIDQIYNTSFEKECPELFW